MAMVAGVQDEDDGDGVSAGEGSPPTTAETKEGKEEGEGDEGNGVKEEKEKQTAGSGAEMTEGEDNAGKNDNGGDDAKEAAAAAGASTSNSPEGDTSEVGNKGTSSGEEGDNETAGEEEPPESPVVDSPRPTTASTPSPPRSVLGLPPDEQEGGTAGGDSEGDGAKGDANPNIDDGTPVSSDGDTATSLKRQVDDALGIADPVYSVLDPPKAPPLPPTSPQAQSAQANDPEDGKEGEETKYTDPTLPAPAPSPPPSPSLVLLSDLSNMVPFSFRLEFAVEHGALVSQPGGWLAIGLLIDDADVMLTLTSVQDISHLTEGYHLLRAFLMDVRTPEAQCLKSWRAYVEAEFFVEAVYVPRSRDFLFGQPSILLLEPRSTVPASADSVLVDMFVHNCTVGENAYHIRLYVNGHALMPDLTQWRALRLPLSAIGAKPGERFSLMVVLVSPSNGDELRFPAYNCTEYSIQVASDDGNESQKTHVPVL